MSVNPGNYRPDNWSSGYRINTVDSADKRAELFNDFSYWMVRKFEIEIDTRHANDMNIINLINNATGSIDWLADRRKEMINTDVGLRGSIEWLAERRLEMMATDSSLKGSIDWLSERNKEKDGSIGELYKITVASNNSIDWLSARRLEMLGSIDELYKITVASNNSIDWLRDRRLEMLGSIDELYKITSATNNVNVSQSESLAWLSARNDEKTSSISELYNITSATNKVNVSQSESLGWLGDRNNENTSSINELYLLSSAGALKNINQDLNLSRLSDEQVQQNASLLELYSLTAAADNKNGGQDSAILDLYALGDSMNNRITQNTNLINSIDVKDYTALLTAMNANQLLTTGAVNSASTKNDENLTLINATLKGLKFSDGNTVDKDFYSHYFNPNYSKVELGISEGDGIFVRLVKGQFTRLIAELNRQLTLSLTATTNNIKTFKEYLREEFALLNDWASLQIDWSKIINDNILVAIAALDKIALKPNGDVNVNVPVFDFDRLQKILEALSFGNVVNEAGTNLWDVLKELIETLGGVVEAVVGIVPDLIDKLIALVIPENTKFLDDGINRIKNNFQVKFKSVTDLNTSFSGLYNQPKDLSTMEIEIFEQKFNIFPANLKSALTLVKSLVTGFMVLLTLLSAYKRIVGSGDVIQ